MDASEGPKLMAQFGADLIDTLEDDALLQVNQSIESYNCEM